MRQDFFTYQPAFKLFIAGNHQPRLRNVDEAIRRRLCLLPFRVSIPKTERDPCLDLKLAAEASGILAWAVQGCLAYQSEGLNIPASVSDMTSEYLEEQDSLGLWLNARCRVGAGHSATLALLWESWSGFADEEGLPLGGKHKFSARLSQRGFTKKRQAGKGATQFEGVTLIQPHQPERS
jgi:putative DNA primase/helicase